MGRWGGGDLKLSRCKQGLKCAMMGMKREKVLSRPKTMGTQERQKKRPEKR